jgi:hypothetical protein
VIVAQTFDLLKVAWFRRRQLPEGVSGVFQELHLSQVRAERVSRGSDCGDRRVARLLGGVPRLFRSVPKRLPFLPN